MTNFFDVVVADPPWNFSDLLKMSNVKRGADSNYPTMSLQDIKNLPVKKLASPGGSILCLWVPSSLLAGGLDVMKAWQFKQKSIFVWNKTKKDVFADTKKLFSKKIQSIPKLLNRKEINQWIEENIDLDNSKLNKSTSFGLGRLFRQSHEICLIGINNTGIYKKLTNKSQRSVCFAENIRHSQKPEALQDSLDLMFSGENIKKLELYARRNRLGWQCLGNEIDGCNIKSSIEKLIVL